MSEPNNPNDNDKDPKQAGQQPDLFGELQTLGRQLGQTVRDIFDHERVRSFQRDLFSGMQEFLIQIQGIVKTFQDNSQVKEWTERGQQAFSQARDHDSVKDFQQTVARGMSHLNQQLDAFSQRTQQRRDDATAEGAPDTPPSSEAGEQQPGAAANQDVFEELNKLRQNLEQSGRGVMSSENAQKMQSDITNTIQQVLTQAQKSVQSVQDNPQVKEWSERGQQAVNQAQQNQVVRDLQQTMANSLAYFNQQLAELRARQEQQEEQAAARSAQSVPIDIEGEEDAPRSTHADPADAASGPATGVPGASGTPATGPTRKLDPDSPDEGDDKPHPAPAQPAQSVPIDIEGEEDAPPATGPTRKLDPDSPDEGDDKPQQ